MTKKTIYMQVSVHWVKAQIMLCIYDKKIDLEQDTLREIAYKIGLKPVAPQVVKHHLEALVNMGTLAKINGHYAYIPVKKLLKPHQQNKIQ